MDRAGLSVSLSLWVKLQLPGRFGAQRRESGIDPLLILPLHTQSVYAAWPRWDLGGWHRRRSPSWAEHLENYIRAQQKSEIITKDDAQAHKQESRWLRLQLQKHPKALWGIPELNRLTGSLIQPQLVFVFQLFCFGFFLDLIPLLRAN